jgi:chromosome segregation ATPase
MDLNSKLAIY